MPQKGLPTVTAIIVAAGASRRMGFDKLSYCLPDGRTVLETSCALFAAHPAVDELVLVAGGNRPQCEAIAAACPKPCTVVQGGATRADSVHNGLAAAKGQLVAIHDAARPFALLEGNRPDGACASSGLVAGTYLHGLFAGDALRRHVLAQLGAGPSSLSYDAMVTAVLEYSPPISPVTSTPALGQR